MGSGGSAGCEGSGDGADSEGCGREGSLGSSNYDGLSWVMGETEGGREVSSGKWEVRR